MIAHVCEYPPIPHTFRRVKGDLKTLKHPQVSLEGVDWLLAGDDGGAYSKENERKRQPLFSQVSRPVHR